jgi:uncharacterized protein YdaU (DUF1376 family)
MHYYQFNIGDYISHTSHLEPLEDLAYRRLLDLYYLTEEPITQNIPLVSRRLRLGSEVIESVLNEFFELTEFGYKNKRVEEEIAKYNQFLTKQKVNGIKGGRPKKTHGIPKPNPSLTQNNPKQEPINTKHTHISSSKVNTPPNVSDETWSSFIAQRKLSKATISQTVINSFQREADKAGWTLEAALAETVARGWRGFKADWVKDKPVAQQQLKSFKQMDEERSKARADEMMGKHRRETIDITPTYNPLELN